MAQLEISKKIEIEFYYDLEKVLTRDSICGKTVKSLGNSSGLKNLYED